MQWSAPLHGGLLLRRYKRFLADVELASGEVVTVHCPNTGAMTGCDVPGSRVWLSPSGDPRRKTPYTWELVEDSDGELICIHSALANHLVAEALAAGRLSGLPGYTRRRREARLEDDSRIDFLLQGEGLPDCYLEVKSVTLHRGAGLGQFPDTVSLRASRHIRSLMAARARGCRVLLCFALLHSGIRRVAPAADIDPAYARVLAEAIAGGLEVRALGARLSPQEITLEGELPFTV